MASADLMAEASLSPFSTVVLPPQSTVAVPTQKSETKSLEAYVRALSANCKCTERQVGYAFFVFILAIGSAVYAVVVYLVGVENAKRYLREKLSLRASTKATASNVAPALATSSSPASQTTSSSSSSSSSDRDGMPNVTEPHVARWLEWVRTQRFGRDGKGHYFVLHRDGTLLAHGKGGHGDSLVNMDSSDPQRPLTRILSVARGGGGFVHYRWRKERMMVAYVYPINGTGLVLGGAITVPRFAQASAAARISSEAAGTAATIPDHRPRAFGFTSR